MVDMDGAVEGKTMVETTEPTEVETMVVTRAVGTLLETTGAAEKAIMVGTTEAEEMIMVIVEEAEELQTAERGRECCMFQLVRRPTDQSIRVRVDREELLPNSLGMLPAKRLVANKRETTCSHCPIHAGRAAHQQILQILSLPCC